MSGIRPITPPTLMSACVTIHAVTPPASSMPKRSGARSATRTPSTAITANSAITINAPRKPNSSPMIAKMKSVWASGKKPHLALPSPSPVPGKPPDAIPTSDCDSCQQSPLALRFGCKKHVSRARRTDEPATRYQATTANPPVTDDRGTRGVPARYSTARTIDAITMAVPRSGCTITNSDASPSTNSGGHIVAWRSSMRSARRASRSAV